MKSLFVRLGILGFGLVAALCTLSASANPGDVDTTYGSNGYFLSTAGDEATASLVQPDGKLVFVGRCSLRTGAWAFCITRLTTQGTLDSGSFGPTPSPTGRVVILAGDTNSNDERAVSVSRFPDGRLIVGGNCTVASARQWCFLRFSANGVLDTTFGNNGRAYIPAATGGTFGTSGPNTFTTVKALANGKTLAAGSWSTGLGTERMLVFRLTANGALDTTFAAPSGYALLDGLGVPTNGGFQVNGLALRADNRIVAAGVCERLFVSGGIGNPNYFTSKACLWLLNGDGSNDPSFMGNYYVPATITGASSSNADNSFSSVSVALDGTVVAGGTCGTTAAPRMCYLAYLFPTLLESGLVSSSIKSTAASVGPTGDSRWLLLGSNPLSSTTGAMALAVVSADYSALLSGDQVASPVAGGYNSGSAGGGIQPDGKIVIAGNCGTTTIRACAARLEGFPQTVPKCSLDLDGDGTYSATVDGVIAARVMLGLTGTAVTNGVGFPSNALRTTWTDLRTFLVSQCGMPLP